MAAIVGIAGTAWQAKRAREAATADLTTSLDAAAGYLLAGELACGSHEPAPALTSAAAAGEVIAWPHCPQLSHL